MSWKEESRVDCWVTDCEPTAAAESTGAGAWTLDAGDAADADEIREGITGVYTTAGDVFWW